MAATPQILKSPKPLLSLGSTGLFCGAHSESPLPLGFRPCASPAAAMEFWGVEVPIGKPLPCDPGEESYVHISQAALGESKNGKGSERVILKVTVGNTEVVVGTLSHGRCDQTPLDLIFDKQFKLSHNSTASSVYFCGYKTDAVNEEDRGGLSLTESESESEEDIPNPVIPVKENGKPGAKGGKSELPHPKPVAKPTSAKAEAAVVEVKSEAAKAKPVPKEEEDDDDDDDDDDEDDEDEDVDEDDEMLDTSDEDDMDSDDDDVSDGEDEDESEDEEIKPVGKKRPLDGMKTPVSEKKPKIGTPLVAGKPGTGGKKEAKTPATPAPAPKPQQQQSAKKDAPAKKTPAKENVSPKQQSGKEGSKASTPASGKKIGQFLCQPCNKSFTSESAMTQHNTAKHK